MVRAQPIPIILLTGFLGSGKTTLLANWLRAPAFSDAMVIVNEFGEVGLDHALLTSSSEAPLLIEGGCACCTAAGDLNETLERLYFDRIERRIPPFRWLLIETTGLAAPAGIIEAIGSSELLASRYAIAAVVTTVDALSAVRQIDEFSEVRDQIEAADCIIVTKTDVADEAAILAAIDAVGRIAPAARVLPSAAGAMSADEMLVATAGARQHPVSSQGHDHHACDAGHGAHTQGISSVFLAMDGPVDPECLRTTIDETLAAQQGRILRIKGLVSTREGPALVQVTCDGPVAISPMPAGGPVGGRSSVTLGLTIIARMGAAGVVAAELSARYDRRRPGSFGIGGQRATDSVVP